MRTNKMSEKVTDATFFCDTLVLITLDQIFKAILEDDYLHKYNNKSQCDKVLESRLKAFEYVLSFVARFDV